VVLTDLESKAGTVLDGVRLLPLQPTLLRDSATIGIGPFEIEYRMEPSVDGVTPPAPRPNGRPAAAAKAMPADAREHRHQWRQAPARPASPEVFGGKYMDYLPVIFHDSAFLKRFLGLFEAIWEPLEGRQDHIAMYFDPRTCPVSWLPWFASWFGIDLPVHWPESRIRELIAESVHLYRWRGTTYGLQHLLEVCTGLEAEIVPCPTDRFVFRVLVRLPEDAPRDIRSTLDALIAAHKPAHTGYVLEVMR
jgi:phage tail-like protein